MAQMNPNFEIDFSDINSYEQIQLINDTQLAKENLLMHRAYKEPSDDEIIRNHFSSFTFIDFCPKLFTAKTSSIRQQQNADSELKQTIRHYELETFSDLFDRINAWLKLNKNWRVVSMETLVYDCTSQFNHVKSSIYSSYLPQNTRGLRLFLSPSKSRFSGPQRIGCINVVPRKVSGSYTKQNEPVVYETLDEILQRLNELLLTRPIEGRILSVETITLPMVNGYVNTESNYFMDSRLNLLNQHTYNIKHVASTTMTTAMTHNPSQTESARQLSGSNLNLLHAHNLMDILRVYYEFGPMVCGLVNLIDFVPRFYSPTSINDPANSAHSEPKLSANQSSDTAQGDDDETATMNRQKIASTESLTRLIRRSLAWFESERKQVLKDTAQKHQPNQASSSPAPPAGGGPVNLKVCNLQVHHKTLLKSQLVQITPANVSTIISTRTMSHQSVAFMEPLTCSQCSTSTATKPAQDWCSHLLELSQTFQVKFVRLAYVVPVYNKYARPLNPLRSLKVDSSHRPGPLASASGESQTRLANQVGDDESSSTSSPSSSSASSTSSSRSSSPSLLAERRPSISRTSDGLDQLAGPSSSSEQVADAVVGQDCSQPATSQPASRDEEEYAKQAALEIVNGTNHRHKLNEQTHQLGLTDDGLNDAHIGQLTYRLFAPCQLVNSSSCFAINPVNSSSPLARRGSVDLNGSGISSENAHPSTSLLGSSSNQYSEAQQMVTSFGAFFPALSQDIIAGSYETQSPRAQANTASKFTTNEFEPVEAIRRRMEVYVTTNSMKVLAGETLIVNLSDILSCLSTAIEQTVVGATFSQNAPTTWVNVYVLYAAVEEPQLPGQLLAQQKLRELALIEESLEEEQSPEVIERLFDDNDEFQSAAKTAPSSSEQTNPAGGAIRIEQDPIDSTLTLYNSAYDRTVALPTQPESHLDSLGPVDFLGSDTDCLWMNEADLFAEVEQHRQIDRKSGSKKKKKKVKAKRHGKSRHEDSQCSIM